MPKLIRKFIIEGTEEAIAHYKRLSYWSQQVQDQDGTQRNLVVDNRSITAAAWSGPAVRVMYKEEEHDV